MKNERHVVAQRGSLRIVRLRPDSPNDPIVEMVIGRSVDNMILEERDQDSMGNDRWNTAEKGERTVRALMRWIHELVVPVAAETAPTTEAAPIEAN